MRDIGVIAVAVLAFLLGYRVHQPRIEEVVRIQRDTIAVTEVRVDTIYRDNVVYRHLPAVEVVRTDTIILADTIFVAVPIDTYIAKDSTYLVEATGYDVQFQRIEVYPTTIYRTERVITPKRLGVGIHAGYGATKHGLSPYIGVGINYNLVMF